MAKLTLPISKAEVELKEFLTVGEAMELKKIIRAGAKVSFQGKGKEIEPRFESYDFDAEDRAEMKALELLVTDVTIDGKVVGFSPAWYLGLHEADGTALIEKVNEIRRPKAPSPPEPSAAS